MKRLGLGIALGLVAVAGIVLAHIPENGVGVHFHNGKTDFGLVPRRGILRWGEMEMGEGITEQGYPTDNDGIVERGATELREPDENESEDRAANRRRWTEQALKISRQSRWKKARHTVRYIGRRFKWTGELRDLDTVLGRILALPTKQRTALKPAMKVYLNALEHELSVEGFEKLAAMKNAGFLHEHARYQLLASQSLAPEIRSGCQKFLSEFPHSPKREDAVIMIARNAILPASPKDRNISEGKMAIAQLKHEFPHSRFLKELPGLRTRLLFLDGKYTLAANAYLKIGNLDSVRLSIEKMTPSDRDLFNAKLMAAHLRKVTRTPSYYVWEGSLAELKRLRSHATAQQTQIMSKILRADPELASDYLYYRLNHALSRKSDRKQLAQFAAGIVAAHPGAKFSPKVLTQLAEVSYRNHDYRRALNWAERSLRTKTTDRALYVRGAAKHKLKRIAGATQDFERMIRHFPKSSLIPAARENLALLYEAAGRYDKALDSYFALGRYGTHALMSRYWWREYEQWYYRPDIAYLIDARMTTDQVAAYVRSHPHHSHHDLLVYSLGIRYLRDERWNEAEREFRRLPLEVYEYSSAGRKDSGEKPSPEPLIAVRDLRLLHRKIASAHGDARAKAMYDYASYYSTHGTLLLYNYALWHEERMYSFDWWWNNSVATKQDELAVRRYMYRHEAYARSRAICKETARLYPKAKIMPYLLYRQAAATNRLTRFNQWWNKESDRAKLRGDAVSTMRRIARNYPKHPAGIHARKYAAVFEQERKEVVWRQMERKKWEKEEAQHIAAKAKNY